jgi:hypothetical protein
MSEYEDQKRKKKKRTVFEMIIDKLAGRSKDEPRMSDEEALEMARRGETPAKGTGFDPKDVGNTGRGRRLLIEELSRGGRR